MTNNEILQADVLDILFENRNKAYGAYAIRRTYGNRMAWATGGALVIVLLCSFAISNATKQKADLNNYKKDEVILTEFTADKKDIPVEKEEVKPKAATKTTEPTATIKVTPAVIVDDSKVKDIIPETNGNDDKQIDTKTTTGNPYDGTPTEPEVKPSGGDGLVKKDDKDGGDFVPVSRDASYPGGAAAFAQFLSKYLSSPDDLEPGEKKTVLVKFVVDAEGNISQIQILQSGGDKYDKEVMRVLRKMPKWMPAEQNGHKVSVNFTQPVTFIGQEQ